MAEHATRDHATWSASATERNWQCPGALALTMDLPERSSEVADWGTACHQVAEKCLRTRKDAVDFIGTTEKGKEHSFEVDDEMAETAQTYVDYVLGEWLYQPLRVLHIEQKFSLAALNPPFEAGGTADAVVYKPDEKNLEVIDLKGGRGHVVEVVGNPQLRTYALGAMLANPGLDVSTITVTIVQPRAPHKSGRIRSETFHVADLLEWTGDLLAAMKRSKAAIDSAIASKAEWNSTFLNAGSWCKFCKAAGFCPALQQKAYDAAGVWFDDLDKPRLANSPDAMSPEAIAQALDAADMIGDWINAVRAYAHAQAESGAEIPGYILVPKEGREKWVDDGAAVQAANAAIKAGLDGDKVYNPPKVRTPKQIRDALAKAKLAMPEALVGLSAKPTQGTNLVAADKTTRQAVEPAVNKFFDKID